MAEKDVKTIGQDLKNSGVAYGPLTYEQERKNNVSLSASSFGLGIGYDRKISENTSLGASVHTGGAYSSSALAMGRIDWKPLKGDLDAGTALGTIKGDLGLFGAVTADRDRGIAPMAGVTGGIKHVKSGLNAGVEFGYSPFSSSTFNSQPYYSGKGDTAYGGVKVGWEF